MIPRCAFLIVMLTTAMTDPLIKSSIEDCFKKDSLSCVQMQFFRNVRSFFDLENVEVFGGLSLVKKKAPEDYAARDLEDSFEKQIMFAENADQREILLETYAIDKVRSFFQQRSLSWNMSPLVSKMFDSARALAESVPLPFKHNLSKIFAAGRGKKKKVLKILVPVILSALKIMVVVFGVLAYIVITLTAKKALLHASTGLILTLIMILKKIASQPATEVQFTNYHHAVPPYHYHHKIGRK